MVTPKPKVVIYSQVSEWKFIYDFLYNRIESNVSTMAFFGLTNLGYQDPMGDTLIVNPKKASQGKTSWNQLKPSNNLSASDKTYPWLSDSSAYIFQSGKSEFNIEFTD